MDAVVIRDVVQTDMSAIKRIIGKTWGAGSEEESVAPLGLYLNQILYQTTFGRVAELNGEVVGVILGEVKTERPVYRMMQEDGMVHTLAMFKSSVEERQGFHDFITTTNENYKQLVADYKDEYQGVVTLLAVDADARGLNLGRKLWDSLVAHFKCHDVKKFYLSTDDIMSSFGFYDRVGCVKKNEHTITVEMEGEQVEVNSLMYEYEIE